MLVASMTPTKRFAGLAGAALLITVPLVPGLATPAQAQFQVSQDSRCEPTTQVGTSSSETLFGSPDDDRIDSLEGSDQIVGFDGDDRLCGDDDSDQLNGGGGDDFLFALVPIA